jgi:hypothetical protein
MRFPLARIVQSSLAEQARQVIAFTASAWSIAAASPQAVARRAPHGYVPVRMARRIRAAAGSSGRALLAHSW